MNQPFVSVIIPTYNRKAWLRELLDSLAQQTYPADRFEVIVVDDGSSDGTGEIAGQPFPFRLRYFRQTNQGDAAARNLGAQQSQADILLFLDDDILLEKNYLAHVVPEHVSHPKRIVVGTDILWLADTNPLHDPAYRPPPPTSAGMAALPFVDVCSNNMSLRREAYFAIGMMDGLGFSGSSIWCDVDMAYRAYCQGFEFLQHKQAICWHRDHVAVSLESQKKRLREAAYRAVVLFQKNPALVHHLPMFADKTPINFQHDSLALVARKIARRISALPPILALMEFAFARLRNTPLRRPLRRWILGGCIYRGFQEGRKKFGPIHTGPASFSSSLQDLTSK